MTVQAYYNPARNFLINGTQNSGVVLIKRPEREISVSRNGKSLFSLNHNRDESLKHIYIYKVHWKKESQQIVTQTVSLLIIFFR